MRNTTNYILILIFMTFLGCATKYTPPPGIPIWDYEEDEINRTDHNTTSIGAVIGGLVGAVATSIKKVVQSEIELEPNNLFRVIETALVKGTLIENQTPMLGAHSLTKSRWYVSESNEGQIITDWKTIKGKTVGLLLWKKKYQTEVRHTITIKRSYKSKDNSNFTIETEVRERPNSNYEWAKANPELGRSSFTEIKNVLLDAVRKYAQNRRIEINEH